MDNIKKLTTEGNNNLTTNIDSMESIDILRLINQEDQKVADCIKDAIPAISKLVDELALRMEQGGRLIYCGAGTSGRIGLLDAVECPPTYGVDPSKVVCLMAGGPSAFSYAKEGAEDDSIQAVKDLDSLKPNKYDTLVGIAASGRTPYVIGMINHAKELNMLTACIVNSKDSALSKIVDIKIEAITGSEVISGSTRMKAGTAQKLICNMISTAVMIKLGHVYKNYMIDLKATNEKLVARQLNIITSICDIDEEEAKKSLLKYQTVKKVILHYLTKIDDVNKLDELLDQNHQSISKVMEALHD